MKRSNEKQKKDFYTVVMIVQTVVGAVLVIAMILSFRGEGRFLALMTDGYLEYMTVDYSAEDISQTFDEFADFSSSAVAKLRNDTVAVFAEENISEYAVGGIDLEFSSLETLEGISFEDIDAGFSMIYPLDDYVLTSAFGYRTSPVSGEAGIHTGLDMAADYGTDICAAADGTVVDSAWDDSYGNYVKILHENNIVSIYAHCSRLCVDEGERVRAGKKIAEVGSTGASTGNHLHFEVRKDNIRINPMNLLDEK